jgi:hypothetical protein
MYHDFLLSIAVLPLPTERLSPPERIRRPFSPARTGPAPSTYHRYTEPARREPHDPRPEPSSLGSEERVLTQGWASHDWRSLRWRAAAEAPALLGSSVLRN